MAPCHKSNTYHIGTPRRSYRNLHQKRRNSLSLSDSRVNLCMEVSNSAWWHPHHGTTGFNLPIPEVLFWVFSIVRIYASNRTESERDPERTIVQLDFESDWMASREWLTLTNQNWHCDSTVIEELLNTSNSSSRWILDCATCIDLKTQSDLGPRCR